MTSSKIYALRNDIDGVWCVAYHNGTDWRVQAKPTGRINPTDNQWFTWIGNPVKDLFMDELGEVNNFKEKAKC